MPDGTIAKVKLDFDTLKNLSRVAIDEYGLSGAVQHGASTLPADAFDKFPETCTSEVHLATEFQNMIYENSVFPKDFKNEIYEFLRGKYASDRKEGETEEQFIYKIRKNGFGLFKERFWNLPSDVKNKIGEEFEAKFDFLFKKLNIIHSKEIIKRLLSLLGYNYLLPPTFHDRLLFPVETNIFVLCFKYSKTIVRLEFVTM